MTVFAALAKQAEGDVTPASIAATVSALDMASAQRVRGICDRLQGLGVAQVAGAGTDPRRRTLRVSGGWLDDALQDWLLICFRALTPSVDALPCPSLAAVVRFSSFAIDALERGGLHPVVAWPAYRAVRDHIVGWPLIAELVGSVAAGAVSPTPTISRKALALAYGVSRIHVAGLINGFEMAGWLFRPPGGDRLAFVPEGLARLRFQFACDLAWVAMAFADPPDPSGSIGTAPPPVWTGGPIVSDAIHAASEAERGPSIL